MAQSPGRREELVREAGGGSWRGLNTSTRTLEKYRGHKTLSLLTDICNPAGGCRLSTGHKKDLSSPVRTEGAWNPVLGHPQPHEMCPETPLTTPAPGAKSANPAPNPPMLPRGNP